MTRPTWRAALLRRLGWSLGAASLWTWGLLALRMLRDGLQPLEVWFGYGLSFFMTAVYVYLGLLIYSTFLAERGDTAPQPPARPHPAWAERLARAWGPVTLLGLAGLLIAALSVAGWLLLRYPGPQAVSGTYASVVLALMILAVVAISTALAKEPSE